MRDLLQKVAVVTGAGSGIGRALAEALAAEGCHLALVDISEQGLQKTAADCSALDVRVTTHCASVCDVARMRELPAEIEQAHGAIDLLFNNAGVTVNKAFEENSLDDLDYVVNINLWGVIYGCHFFLPYLRKRAESHIVNTSSMMGFLGMPDQASYSLSKAAVKSLSESLRVELARHNMGVTSIHPGTIRTNILRAAASISGPQKDKTESLAMLMERIGMPPEKLAQKVIKAVKKNKMQVRIGVDAYLIDWLKRLFPHAIHSLLQWGYGRERREV